MISTTAGMLLARSILARLQPDFQNELVCEAKAQHSMQGAIYYVLAILQMQAHIVATHD